MKTCRKVASKTGPVYRGGGFYFLEGNTIHICILTQVYFCWNCIIHYHIIQGLQGWNWACLRNMRGVIKKEANWSLLTRNKYKYLQKIWYLHFIGKLDQRNSNSLIILFYYIWICSRFTQLPSSMLVQKRIQFVLFRNLHIGLLRKDKYGKLWKLGLLSNM